MLFTYYTHIWFIPMECQSPLHRSHDHVGAYVIVQPSVGWITTLADMTVYKDMQVVYAFLALVTVHVSYFCSQGTRTLLMMAAEENKGSMVAALLEQKASIDLTDIVRDLYLVVLLLNLK